VTCEEDVKRTKYPRARFGRITLRGQKADYESQVGGHQMGHIKNEKHARASRDVQYLRKHNLSTSYH